MANNGMTVVKSDLENGPDFEETIRSLWENFSACQEAMLSGFPTVRDAYWYGTFSAAFQEKRFSYGEPGIAEIIGEKELRDYFETHEEILRGMYGSVNRLPEEEPEEQPLQAILD